MQTRLTDTFTPDTDDAEGTDTDTTTGSASDPSHPTINDLPQTTPGNVTDTYHAALQYSPGHVPDDAWRIAVVRSPVYGIETLVHMVVSSLAPPTALLDEFKDRCFALQEEGFDGVDAHNQAWLDVNVADRYLAYLTCPATTHGTDPACQCDAMPDENTAVRSAISKIDIMRRHRPVVTVCYESTAKRCHREVLLRWLTTQLSPLDDSA